MSDNITDLWIEVTFAEGVDADEAARRIAEAVFSDEAVDTVEASLSSSDEEYA